MRRYITGIMDVLKRAREELIASLLSNVSLKERVLTANKLQHVMEDMELLTLATNVHDSHPLSHDFYSILLAVAIMSGNDYDARYLWKRLPQELKLNNEIRALHAIFMALQMRRVSDTYLIIEQTKWRTELKPIIACLRGVLRDRMVQSLSKAYLSIGTQSAAQMLGFPSINADFQTCKKRLSDSKNMPLNICAVCDLLGWKSNAQSLFLYPQPIVSEVECPLQDAQLETFANSILHLEEKVTLPAFS
uniref:COP9 signalosome complex subunit putative n=1 Tax=Albugo laibachii Nc14 TaxID=890382 RepID=F0W9E7_9STRA|nr:COP9 signalosome complex subunit putative [Albugo laibachii Nc14]|eukprot:CCA17761.1 COP9 signalosome complex subunit putative [Albugo laibachii Nc14]